MMGLSRKLLFAIEAVLEVAHNGGGALRSAEITDREGIPRRYLEPVLQELVRDGILVSVRGPSGGYQLARDRGRISIGDIVRTVRPLETGQDVLTDPAGTVLGHQVVRPLWLELQQEMMRRLDGISLEDLCAKADRVGTGSTVQASDGKGPKNRGRHRVSGKKCSRSY